ncbi:MAG TPA: hypothetical protein DCF44_00925 [Chitinophagaceae bacterium]|nr:hypothetical protein [Chitinophagaceae bacterium]
MIQIKFKNNQTRQFEFYTELHEHFIKRTSGKITPLYGQPPVCFWVDKPSVRIAQPNMPIPPAMVVNVSQPCYYIEGGWLYFSDPYYGLGFLMKENITHFRDTKQLWHPINEIWLGNFAVVSDNPMVFTSLSPSHHSDFTDKDEITKLNLTKASNQEFFEEIKVREWFMI